MGDINPKTRTREEDPETQKTSYCLNWGEASASNQTRGQKYS